LDHKKKRHSYREISFEDMIYPLSDGETGERRSPYDLAEARERMALMDTALNGLPRSTQTILAMFHAQSMSYDEIADSLNLPIGTVKSRLNRARHRLRVALNPARSAFLA
jgi:RNA polymerase sigma-70 factor (ECF subfamily)